MCQVMPVRGSPSAFLIPARSGLPLDSIFFAAAIRSRRSRHCRLACGGRVPASASTSPRHGTRPEQSPSGASGPSRIRKKTVCRPTSWCVVWPTCCGRRWPPGRPGRRAQPRAGRTERDPHDGRGGGDLPRCGPPPPRLEAVRSPGHPPPAPGPAPAVPMNVSRALCNHGTKLDRL